MHAKFGGELSFLVTEFTKMEAQLSLEVGGALTTVRWCFFLQKVCGFVSGGVEEKEHLGNSVRTPLGGDTLYCGNSRC